MAGIVRDRGLVDDSLLEAPEVLVALADRSTDAALPGSVGSLTINCDSAPGSDPVMTNRPNALRVDRRPDSTPIRTGEQTDLRRLGDRGEAERRRVVPPSRRIRTADDHCRWRGYAPQSSPSSTNARSRASRASHYVEMRSRYARVRARRGSTRREPSRPTHTRPATSRTLRRLVTAWLVRRANVAR